MVYAVTELQLWRWHWLFLGDFLHIAAKGRLVNLSMSLLPQRRISRNPVYLSLGMLGSLFPEFTQSFFVILIFKCRWDRGRTDHQSPKLYCWWKPSTAVWAGICLRSLCFSLCDFTLGWPWNVKLLQCLCVEPRPTLRCISCKRVFLWKMLPAGMFSVWRRNLCFCDHTLTKLSRHCRVAGGCD